MSELFSYERFQILQEGRELFFTGDLSFKNSEKFNEIITILINLLGKYDSINLTKLNFFNSYAVGTIHSYMFKLIESQYDGTITLVCNNSVLQKNLSIMLGKLLSMKNITVLKIINTDT